MILKIILYGALTVTVIVLVVIAIGYALPQSHVASREAIIVGSPPAVFATISDVGRHPEWRPDITRVEILASEPLKWREHAGGDVVTFEAMEIRPSDFLRVRIADPDLPFGGTWTYELAAEGTGTRLRITEHGEVYNPFFRFMSRFVFGHTATMDSFIAALRRRMS